MTTQQRRPGGDPEAPVVSLAADSSVCERRAYGRVRLVLSAGLVENGVLTTLGRSRLADLMSAPRGHHVVVDVSGHGYVMPDAHDLMVKAADRGVIFIFEHPDYRVEQRWAWAVMTGRCPSAY